MRVIKINPAVGCHYFPPGLQLLSQPLTVQLCILSKKWGLAATDMWPCGKRQTMSHIVYSCPQTELEAGAAAIALSWWRWWSLNHTAARKCRYSNSHAIYGITQCYLPPDRRDIPAFTPAEAGTRLTDPGGMQGWVDLVGLLHIEIVYPPEDDHPSKY